MGKIFVGVPWQGQSPTRPDPTTYRHADGGDYQQLVYEITTSISGQISLTLPVDCPNIPGTPVYLKTNGHVDIAKADSIVTTNVLGILNTQGLVQVNGTLTLQTSQWDVITGGSGGLITGTWYWLSDKDVGKLVTVEPETLGHYSVALIYALSSTEALVQLNAPDFVVESLFVRVNDTLGLLDSATTTHVALISVTSTANFIDLADGVRTTDGIASSTISFVDTAIGDVIPPEFIYFEDAATSLISKSNSDGTGIVSICTTLQNTVSKVGVDPTNSLVFWINKASSQLGQIRLGNASYGLKYVPFAGGPETLSASIVKTIPTGFALDPTNRWIYQYGVSGLWLSAYNADGSAAAGLGEPYVPAGIPGGIALDLSGASPIIYLADNGVVKATVNYADLSALVGNTTIYTPLSTVGQIACDEINGYLFVMDGFLLRRMGLNGQAPTTIVNVGSIVNALFVDKGHQKVYYEYGNNVVQSNYDGTGVVTVLTRTNTLDADSGYYAT